MSAIRTTVFGEVETHEVELMEDSIFRDSMCVENGLVGCIRFSYVPRDSRTPAQFHAQPSLAIARLREPTGTDELDNPRTEQTEGVRVAPRFLSTTYGDPDYARLSDDCAAEILQGADDEGEMGVYHNEFFPQRASHLHTRLQECVPAGNDIEVLCETYGAPMQGDVSRDSFDPKKQFTRVLLQQGRLIVDADWNEQTAILLNYLRALTADVIGWHGGPDVSPGYGQVCTATSGAFQVSLDSNRVKVTGGRYYVDGLLLEVPEKQGGYEALDLNGASGLTKRIVLAEAWERCVSTIGEPGLLDPALGGLDTAVRGEIRFRFTVLFTDIQAVGAVPSKGKAFRKLPVQQKRAATRRRERLAAPSPSPGRLPTFSDDQPSALAPSDPQIARPAPDATVTYFKPLPVDHVAPLTFD